MAEGPVELPGVHAAGTDVLRAPETGAAFRTEFRKWEFGSKLLHSCEINISTLDIRAHQLYAQLVPNIHSLLPMR